MNANDLAQQLRTQHDTEEGFPPDMLAFVDLKPATLTVIAFRGEGLEQAVEAIRFAEDLYHVPGITGPVEAEDLKRMRLRYLLTKRRQEWIDLGWQPQGNEWRPSF